MTPKINKVLPESSLLIVVGVIIGLILYSSTKFHVSPLTPNTFFFYMLPPIILGMYTRFCVNPLYAGCGALDTIELCMH